VAPIMGSLPRSLRPHDVVVWIRSHRPGECTRRRSLRGIRQGQGRSTPPRTGSPQGGLTTKHLVCTAVPTATTATVFPPPTTADCETDAFSLFYPDKIRGRTDRHHTKQHRSLRNSTRTPGRFPKNETVSSQRPQAQHLACFNEKPGEQFDPQGTRLHDRDRGTRRLVGYQPTTRPPTHTP